MTRKLNEASEFTIPLKNLLGLVAFTAISVWAYFGIIERLAFIEHEQDLMLIEIEENDDWIDEFKPPAEVQDTIKRVRELELQLAIIKERMKH
jgi:hypothetical protein